jgi:hypothetical protein
VFGFLTGIELPTVARGKRHYPSHLAGVPGCGTTRNSAPWPAAGRGPSMRARHGHAGADTEEGRMKRHSRRAVVTLAAVTGGATRAGTTAGAAWVRS